MAWKIEQVTINNQTFTPVTVPAGMNTVRFFRNVKISDSGDISKPLISISPISAYGQHPQDYPVEAGQVFYLMSSGYDVEYHEILFFRAPQPAGFTGTLDISSK